MTEKLDPRKGRSRRSRPSGASGAVAGFILALGVAGLAYGVSHHRQTEDLMSGLTGVPGQRNPGGVGEPCGGSGATVSLEQVGHDMPFQILVPQDELASQANMTEVWECSKDSFEMVFSSGIRIYMETNGIADPETAWRGLANQDPGDTSVGTVRGQPAALIDPAKDETHTADGSVTLVDGGRYITVLGNGELGVDDLIQVTESLG